MPARAKLPPGEGKRVPLNMRTTRELREKLEKEAADSGRSLAQEVEARLERSFTIDEGFGDADTLKFCRLLAQMADMMTLTNRKRWKDDPKWFLYVVGAWTEMVKMRAVNVAPPDLKYYGELVLRDIDKVLSDEELRDLGAQSSAFAKMRSKETEKK